MLWYESIILNHGFAIILSSTSICNATPRTFEVDASRFAKGWYLLNMCLWGMYSNVYNQLYSHTVLQQCCSMQSHRLQALNNHQSFQVHKIYLQHKNEQFFLNSCLVSFYLFPFYLFYCMQKAPEFPRSKTMFIYLCCIFTISSISWSTLLFNTCITDCMIICLVSIISTSRTSIIKHGYRC